MAHIRYKLMNIFSKNKDNPQTDEVLVQPVGAGQVNSENKSISAKIFEIMGETSEDDEYDDVLLMSQNKREELINEIQSEMTVAARPTNIIAKETVIEGKISAHGDIRVLGRVEGPVTADGTVFIEGGIVNGDIQADSLRVTNNAHVIGNATINASVMLDADFLGDIVATEAKLGENSVFTGNLTVKSMTVMAGAKFSGLTNVGCSEMAGGDIENQNEGKQKASCEEDKGVEAQVVENGYGDSDEEL